MSPSTKVDDKLEAIGNFCAWKYRIGLILEENDLAKLIKGVVSDTKEHVQIQRKVQERHD